MEKFFFSVVNLDSIPNGINSNFVNFSMFQLETELLRSQ